MENIKKQLAEFMEKDEKHRILNTLFLIKTFDLLFDKYPKLTIGVWEDERGCVSHFQPEGAYALCPNGGKEIYQSLINLSSLSLLSCYPSDFNILNTALNKNNLWSFAELFKLSNGDSWNYKEILANEEKKSILESQCLSPVAVKRVSKSL